MNLRALSDRHRIRIGDVVTSRDDPDGADVRSRLPTNVEGPIPERAEKRLLAIAETMGDCRERLRPDPPAATTGGCGKLLHGGYRNRRSGASLGPFYGSQS